MNSCDMWFGDIKYMVPTLYKYKVTRAFGWCSRWTWLLLGPFIVTTEFEIVYCVGRTRKLGITKIHLSLWHNQTDGRATIYKDMQRNGSVNEYRTDKGLQVRRQRFAFSDDLLVPLLNEGLNWFFKKVPE